MSEVVTLGECLVAFVTTTPGPLAEATEFERHIAGAEANVAVGLTRLGHGVSYIGRVGGDGFGTAILRRLRGEGVDINYVTIDDEARTGIVFRERRVLGSIDVVYHRAGSAGSRIDVDDVQRAVKAGEFDAARWLHITGITPALSGTALDAVTRACEVARDRSLRISLDLNLRRRLWSDEEAAPVLRDLASRVDVVLGSTDELAVVAGEDPGAEAADLAAAVAALNPTLVVAKLGASGALGFESGGAVSLVDAIQVANAVDPIGAGDAFCAGFIAGQLDGVDLKTALRMGNACGALAVAAVGDQAGLPDRAELGRLLVSGGPDTLR